MNDDVSIPDTPRAQGPQDPGGADHFRVLPKRVKPEDWVINTPAEDAPDPEGGRDTDRDFLLRYGAG
jgi:hypothetical protein